MPVEHTPRGAAPGEDPVVAQAMTVWDTLTAGEQREVFRTVAEAVAEYGRTKNIDALAALADSVDGMVRAEAQPGYQEIRRAGSKPPGGPDSGMGMAEVIRRLRE